MSGDKITAIDQEAFRDIVETLEIDPKDLLRHVQEGWRVLLTYAREHTFNQGSTNPQGQYIYNTTSISNPVILVGRTDIERLRALEVQHKDLCKSHTDLKKEQSELAKTHQSVVKELEGVKGSLEFYKDRAGEKQKEYDTQRDLNKKLELDLAKVRTALGDIRWKEIIGT